MKTLQELIRELQVLQSAGRLDRPVERLALDSREVTEHSVFFAIRGFARDGHAYIATALEAGASVIVCEEWPAELLPDRTYLRVPSASEAAGLMAHAFYGYPSHKLRLVGVTGTNGKTTTVTLLFRLMRALGANCGLLSTVENIIGEEIIPATHTTPDAVRLNALLAQMVEAGCQLAFMEVSSHAADQNRIAGLRFAGAVFTNLTHDHLDYHGSFRDYLYAKKKFFDHLEKSAFALINKDDKNGPVMVQNTAATVRTLSLRTTADFRFKVMDNSLEGLTLRWENLDIHTRLVGHFNAYNLLTAFAVAVLLGFDQEEILAALSNVEAARGRFETVSGPGGQKMGIVDYAHTPDALEKVLDTIAQVKKDQARVITVIGCGGDRDKAKRPEMARIAVKMSDQVILTADNPRTEDPAVILEEMLAGIESADRKRALVISDRREAIRTACLLAQAGDVILVAGKGHETYQEIQGVRYPFDDRQILIDTLYM